MVDNFSFTIRGWLGLPDLDKKIILVFNLNCTFFLLLPKVYRGSLASANIALEGDDCCAPKYVRIALYWIR